MKKLLGALLCASVLVNVWLSCLSLGLQRSAQRSEAKAIYFQDRDEAIHRYIETWQQGPNPVGVYVRESEIGVIHPPWMSLSNNDSARIEMNGMGSSRVTTWQSIEPHTLQIAGAIYHIDGDDLIDAFGNRWKRLK